MAITRDISSVEKGYGPESDPGLSHVHNHRLDPEFQCKVVKNKEKMEDSEGPNGLGGMRSNIPQCYTAY